MGQALSEAVDSQCAHCPAHHLAFCAKCTPIELADFENLKYYRRFEPGEVIFWLGEPMGFVATIVSGIATVNQTLPDGRRQMVGLMMPSDFIGDPRRDKAPYDAISATETTLCCIPRRAFQEAMEKSPRVIGQLFEMKRNELDAMQEWMLLLGRKTAREKVASLLLLLVRRQLCTGSRERRGPISVAIELSREEMGDYLGLTTETICRQLSSLRQDGVIASNGVRNLSINSIDRLCAEACEAPESA
ncbi:Crp/Fnr family transcriptional regulator [Solirhodobacter olei]|uniref:Crp/Fnr family transcriptional regulator n=1 Tax=Solirhodobacter olei TaxID=2493082 RepID=UPI000FDA6AC7|nr:Crp/Fnr family transcriptional regulator [Solirhodobacter olei]